MVRTMKVQEMMSMGGDDEDAGDDGCGGDDEDAGDDEYGGDDEGAGDG